MTLGINPGHEKQYLSFKDDYFNTPFYPNFKQDEPVFLANSEVVKVCKQICENLVIINKRSEYGKGIFKNQEKFSLFSTIFVLFLYQ